MSPLGLYSVTMFERQSVFTKADNFVASTKIFTRLRAIWLLERKRWLEINILSWRFVLFSILFYGNTSVNQLIMSCRSTFINFKIMPAMVGLPEYISFHQVRLYDM